MVLRKSFYIRWSAGRSPRVHEVNPGRDPSRKLFGVFIPLGSIRKKEIKESLRHKCLRHKLI